MPASRASRAPAVAGGISLARSGVREFRPASRQREAHSLPFGSTHGMSDFVLFLWLMRRAFPLSAIPQNSHLLGTVFLSQSCSFSLLYIGREQRQRQGCSGTK
jgi:hypothetical protein